jgi:hypothetical protein
MSLQGIPKGNHDLRVTVTDVFGNTGFATVPFIHDAPPTITIASPLESSVSRGKIRITATCADDDSKGCVSLEASLDSPTVMVAKGVSTLDQDVLLGGYDGQAKLIIFIATDSRGQRTSASRTVSVETSAKLKEFDLIERPGAIEIFDVLESRTLYRQSNQSKALVVRDSTKKTESEIPLPPGANPLGGLLTSAGAIFYTPAGTISDKVPDPNLYEFKDGKVVGLGHMYTPDNGRASLRVKGNFAAWSGVRPFVPTDPLRGVSTIFRHDIATGNTVEVFLACGCGYGLSDLAENGDVVFADVYRYRDGAVTRLTNPDSTITIRNSVTDGANVLFERWFAHNQIRRQIFLRNSSGAEVPLTGEEFYIFPEPVQFFQALNGHYSYLKRDGSGVIQVWSDSAQVSFFGSTTALDTLSPAGQLSLKNNNALYKASPGVTPERIGSALGQRYWVGEVLTVAIGRSLFLVDSTQSVAPVPNQRPTVSAGEDQSVRSGQVVTLVGAGGHPEGHPVTFMWTQLSGQPVSLSSPNARIATFTAPSVTAVTGLSFRLTVSDGVLTSDADVRIQVSPDPQTSSPPGGTLVTRFPHFANGGGIISEIVLTNPSTASITLTLDLFDDAGRAFAADFAGYGPQSNMTMSLAPFGATTIRSSGSGPLLVGAVRVTSTGRVGGVIRFTVPGLGTAGVGSGEAGSGAMIPVRRIPHGMNTGIAIADSGSGSSILLTLRNAAGAGVGSTTLSLAPNGHIASFVDQFFGLDSFDGSLTITATSGQITVIGLELGSSAGEFTSLPVTALP